MKILIESPGVKIRKPVSGEVTQMLGGNFNRYDIIDVEETNRGVRVVHLNGISSDGKYRINSKIIPVREFENITNASDMEVAEAVREGCSKSILYDENRVFGIIPVFFSLEKPLRFKDEKAFRAYHGQDRIYGWKEVGGTNLVENDVRDVVGNMNSIPFMFTSGWSHSATPKDHPDNLNWCKNGYFIFKADVDDERYADLKNKLEDLGNVKVYPTKEFSNRDDIFLVEFMDNSAYESNICIVKPGNPGWKQSYDVQKDFVEQWNKVNDIMKLYV